MTFRALDVLPPYFSPSYTQYVLVTLVGEALAVLIIYICLRTLSELKHIRNRILFLISFNATMIAFIFGLVWWNYFGLI